VQIHGNITQDQPLLAVALEEEAAYLWETGLPILVMGVGKISTARSLTFALSRSTPSCVWNLGTAGALKPGLAGTHVIGRVIQHDFDSEALLHLIGRVFAAPIDFSTSGPVLATGDAFVSGGPERRRLERLADLVDMEGYAVAEVCRELGVKCKLVKDVSDGACNSAAKSWRESVDECASRLASWVMNQIN